MSSPSNRMRPIHPGEILREEFLAPINLSANALAIALHVPATRIGEIVNERRGVSPDTALRLARFFGGDAQSWLNLQMTYDLKIAQRDHGARIEQEVRPLERTS
ncbi:MULTISPECIES: HigA family addiction module antitoxin [unclassified Herbaspirillum]|uniref:HigA family addiction module antitoxin n=1 Tax=unclassified Herbaspirillum TaxID=2624150 RepID=UPI000C0AE7A8|nr:MULTISPECIES: HigA family addiction module antitoxin [unclassified Herbaspirillum]MAF03154.1 addiction module antidote protein, HigA family [Herbaspirillum sp.]MBO17468.1 addiction module antidote protein, HigA family [Herbaspirillum sp.]